MKNEGLLGWYVVKPALLDWGCKIRSILSKYACYPPVQVHWQNPYKAIITAYLPSVRMFILCIPISPLKYEYEYIHK